MPKSDGTEVKLTPITPDPQVMDLIGKIDQYEIKDAKDIVETAAQSTSRAKQILGTSYDVLHPDPPTSGTARKDFLEKLALISARTDNEIELKDPDTRLTNPEDNLVTLKDLLGEEVLEAYYAAIKEERESEAFRNAVFLKATKHYEGEKWKDRMVLWVGGPSASGKTFAADAVVLKADAMVMEKQSGNNTGNDVISIDGGIEREISQMRQYVLDVALKKGYAGIDQLDKGKGKLGMKKKIQEAADAAKLNLVIPCTFVDPGEGKNIEGYAADPHVKQIFSKVVGGETQAEKQRFKRSVRRMGNMRAWSSKFSDNDTKNRKIIANNRKMGIESKKYEKYWFWLGKYFSAEARSDYEKAQAMHGKDSIYLSITNDLIFVREKEKGKWSECEVGYQGSSDDIVKLSVRALNQYHLYQKNKKSSGETPEDLREWLKTNSAAYSTAQIELSVNRKKREGIPKPFDPANPDCLGSALLAEMKESGEKHKNAVDSLFQMIAPMEAAAKAAFYMALAPYDKDPSRQADYQKIIDAYKRLSIAQAQIEKAKQQLGFFTATEKKSSKTEKIREQLNAALKEETEALALFDEDTKKFIASIREKIESSSVDWQAVMNAIPADPLNQTNLFAQPIPLIDHNNPRQEDIRQKMSRDIRNYRYIAPKGAGGAQESGPQGGWYLGCYKTPDGKIHTQRFMIKRENQYSKNIIESLSGRLKAGLVNTDKDYSACTYLVRDPSKAAIGKNTYAVSIAFEEFTETHKLVDGVTSRIRMAGTKKAVAEAVGYEGDALAVFKKIGELHSSGFDGLEQALIAAWWTGDNDVHSGNIGVGKKMKRFLAIDHAGSMKALSLTVHPKHVVLHNLKNLIRRHPEPTYHAAEYSSALRNSPEMVDILKRCANNMTAAKIKLLVEDEINTAVKHLRDDPDEFKRFAERIGVPKAFLLDKNIDKCAKSAKKFLNEIMYARLTDMRKYANEIELSLCFEFDKKKNKFVLKNPEKLEQFIRENPNYCLNMEHRFRGKSEKKSRHASEKQLEKLLQTKTQEVLGQKELLGISTLLTKDFAIPIPDRAENYITRLRLIQQIMKDENVLENNPYKDKINELIEFLNVYQSGSPKELQAKKLHLIQACDEAYATIKLVYQTLNLEHDKPAELAAKVKIYEILNTHYNSPELLSEYAKHKLVLPIDDITHKYINDEANENLKKILDKQLKIETFSFDQCAFTQAVKNASLKVEKLATHIHFDVKRKKDIDEIADEQKTIEGLTQQLASLADRKGENKDTINQAAQHAEKAKKELEPKPAEQTLSQQTYLSTTRELTKQKDKTFQEQAADYFQQKTAIDHFHAESHSQTAKLGATVTEDKAILLDNPTTTTKTGAIIINEGGRVQLTDFGNIELSYANLLAKILISQNYVRGVLQEDLRKYIQEKYIDVLHNQIPPEAVSKENLQQLLIKPLMKNNQFHLTLPTSIQLFNRTGSFSGNILSQLNKMAKWDPRSIAWALDELNALDPKGDLAKNLQIQKMGDNPEHARLFLLLLCVRGANPEKANFIQYKFKITDADITRMRDIIENKDNPLHKSVMNYVVDFKGIREDFTQEKTSFAAPRALMTLLKNIQGHLSQSHHGFDLTELERAKKRISDDKVLLQNIDKHGQYIKLYENIPAQLTEKIKAIDEAIIKLTPRLTIR